MKLGDWLRENRMTHEDFAALVDVDHSTISRIIARPGKKQTRKPSLDLAKKIFDATGGQVTANDFVEDEEPDDDAGSGQRPAGTGGVKCQAA